MDAAGRQARSRGVERATSFRHQVRQSPDCVLSPCETGVVPAQRAKDLPAATRSSRRPGGPQILLGIHIMEGLLRGDGPEAPAAGGYRKGELDFVLEPRGIPGRVEAAREPLRRTWRFGADWRVELRKRKCCTTGFGLSGLWY